jgi:hypothetical protein
LLNLKFKSNKSKWESLKFIGKWAAPSKYCEYHLKSESQIPNQFELFKLHQHLINLNNTIDQERSLIISLVALDCKNSQALISFQLNEIIGSKSKHILKFSRQTFEENESKKIYQTDDIRTIDGELCKRFIVSNRTYLIIPAISDLSIETNYLLRILVENIKPNTDSDDDTGDEIEDYDIFEAESQDEDGENKEVKIKPKRKPKRSIKT